MQAKVLVSIVEDLVLLFMFSLRVLVLDVVVCVLIVEVNLGNLVVQKVVDIYLCGYIIKMFGFV